MMSRWLPFLLAALILLMPLEAFVSPKSMIGTVVLFACWGFIFEHKKPIKPTFVEFLVLIFTLLGFLSLIWSIHPHASAEVFLKLSALGLISIGLSRFFRLGDQLSLPKVELHLYKSLTKCGEDNFLQKNFSIFLTIGHILACLYVLTNELANLHLSHMKNLIQGGLFLSLSFWVVLYTLWKTPLKIYWRAAILASITLLTLMALHYVHCDTAGLGVVLGGGVALLLYKCKDLKTLQAIEFLVVLAFLFTPAICFYAFKPDYFAQYNTYIKDPSYLHRIKIWHETAIKIAENPLLGYGLNSSRYVGGKEKFDLEFKNTKGKTQTVKAEKMGMHPHNIALQLWLELGFIGALLGGMITAFFFGIIYHIKDTSKRFFYFGFFTSAMLTFWVNIGAFQTWWLSSILFLIHLFNDSWKNKRDS
ncbi:MAG: O-antigen ligase family protein [Alphaproteobacteria bacterium]|nr:O-antigen ligase family protein [Alphaproteobacteria bacterium]